MKTRIVCIILFLTFSFNSFSQNSEVLKDYDGNVYKTTMIGDQVWMADNLNTTHFRDGSPIAKYTGNNWVDTRSPLYLDYDKSVLNSKAYGKIYNYFTVSDQRKVCPVGWRIPSNDDWKKLISYVGVDYKSSAKIKEKGSLHWKSAYANGTNELGLNLVPGGYFMGDENRMWGIGFNSYWATSDFAQSYSKSFDVYNLVVKVVAFGASPDETPHDYFVSNSWSVKQRGVSIRCIKGDADVAPLPDAEEEQKEKNENVQNSFCYSSYKITLVEGGSYVYVTFGIGGSIAKKLTGEWKASDFFPDGTQRVYMEINNSETVFTLIRNGNGSMSSMIDANGRVWNICK